MLAFGLSIALFVFWGVLGYAFLAVLKIRRSSVQNMLLAPVVGVSVTLLPVFWLNRTGLPNTHFGTALAGASSVRRKDLQGDVALHEVARRHQFVVANSEQAGSALMIRLLIELFITASFSGFWKKEGRRSYHPLDR